jgi:hypothetical protein
MIMVQLGQPVGRHFGWSPKKSRCIWCRVNIPTPISARTSSRSRWSTARATAAVAYCRALTFNGLRAGCGGDDTRPSVFVRLSHSYDLFVTHRFLLFCRGFAPVYAPEIIRCPFFGATNSGQKKAKRAGHPARRAVLPRRTPRQRPFPPPHPAAAPSPPPAPGCRRQPVEESQQVIVFPGRSDRVMRKSAGTPTAAVPAHRPAPLLAASR